VNSCNNQAWHGTADVRLLVSLAWLPLLTITSHHMTRGSSEVGCRGPLGMAMGTLDVRPLTM
jgi:hypothetical protein